MTDFNQFHDSSALVPPPPKGNDMINVLTILTFVGCAFGLMGALYNYLTVCNTIHTMNSSMDALKNSDNSALSGLVDSAVNAARRQCEMRVPLFSTHIAGVVLCLLGALQMRKMKRSGFFIYAIGELAAPIAVFLIGGSMAGIIGTVTTIFTFVFPIVFIILYASQLKHLNK